MKLLPAIGTAALVALLLTGCFGPFYTYRHKLAIEGIANSKKVFATTVVEHRLGNVGMGQISGSTTGEALFLDIGSPCRPLIALLTRRRQPDDKRSECRWGVTEPGCLAKLYGVLEPSWKNHLGGYFSTYPGFDVLSRQRGAKTIDPGNLPDLVTFENITDPKTVIAVNPYNPGKALNCDFEFSKLTIEITDEKVTTGIESNLPWLSEKRRGQIDGSLTHHSENLANVLSAADFQRNGF